MKLYSGTSSFLFYFYSSITILASTSPSIASQRYFHFSNGNKLMYSAEVGNEHEYKIEMIQAGTNEVINKYHFDLSLSVIEDHEDLQNSESMPGSIQVVRSKLPTNEFTWFHTNATKYFLFQDGTVVTPCFSKNHVSISAKLFDYNNEKYVVESYRFKDVNKTYLNRLKDSECIEIDSNFYSFYNNENQLLIDNGTLTVQNSSTRIELNNYIKLWEFEFEKERYQIRTPELGSVEGSKFGTTITRLKDQKVLKVDFNPITLPEGKQSFYEINDGILSLRGIHRKIDLTRFEDEIRRFTKIGKSDAVHNQNGGIVDVVEEVQKNYKEWVSESREHPERFPEKSDPFIIDALAKAVREKRSSVVLGKAGTGKTSAVRAFARDIGLGLIPGIPRTMKIYEVKVANLASGSQFVGTIEERVATLIGAAKRTGCLYFFDEIHSMGGTGTHKSQENDITQFIKGPMENGEMVLIGTDTDHEFHNAFAKDPAFVQRFKTVKLSEMSGKELIEIIQTRLRSERDQLPELSIIEEAIRLSNEYDLTTSQPRAAINLLREAYATMGSLGLEGKAPTLDVLKKATIESYQFDPTLFSRPAAVKKLSQLKDGLKHNLIGQRHAIDAVLSMWKRKLTRVGDPNQVNSILFMGPPGVGKSKIAEASADLMGYQKTVIEMNKYKLMDGAEKFRREIYSALLKNQFQIFVLDEIENADISVQEAALSILQSGKFTVVEQTPSGGTVSRDVNAKHSLFVMTTNAASEFIDWHGKPIGGVTGEDFRLKLIDAGISKKIVSRIQDIVPMGRPSKKQFKKAIASFLKETLERENKKQNAQFALENEAGFIEARTELYTPESDFRDIKRIMKEIDEKIADAVLDPTFEEGQQIYIKWDRSIKPAGNKKPQLSYYL